MPLNVVSVVTRNSETTVTVRGYQLGRLQGFSVYSSNACDEPLDAQWPDAVARAIEDRRRDGGAGKGRVLYAFQLRWLQTDLPVGALAYHLDDGLVRVMSLGLSEAKDHTFGGVIMGLLLDCTQVIAEQHGCSCVEWAVRNEEAARSARLRFGFRRLRRTNRRQRAARGVVLLERRIQ
jgi:hypothetical protein